MSADSYGSYGYSSGFGGLIILLDSSIVSIDLILFYWRSASITVLMPW
jgi:hypothetical protein